MALEEIRHTDQLAAIGISYKPDNLVAKNLYASLGFVDVGIDEEAEEMVAVITV
jgi:diamine N-acetyltransferase